MAAGTIKDIILKYVCHCCVCGPHCTWKSLESIKVVEPNNFLMYNHAWRCDQVECVRARGLVTLCMFSCIHFSVHPHSHPHLPAPTSPSLCCKSDRSLWCLDSFCALMHSCAFLKKKKKKYTRVPADDLCILFKRFAMDVCQSLVQKSFKQINGRPLYRLWNMFIYPVYTTYAVEFRPESPQEPHGNLDSIV